MPVKTPLIIEQHIHGAFGVDFNTVGADNADGGVDKILVLADNLLKHGIGGFYPTLVTDSVENIKRQTALIKKASEECPRILGIHLEGIFINAQKKGIHDSGYFLPLTVENYKKLEDDFIKIVTLAPELDEGLIDYLKGKGVKVQAGHCIGGDLKSVDGVTHTFNAMSGITHREKSTVLSALINDSLYTEIIADGVHVNEDALKLFFKSKPKDKVILVSDALPITYDNVKETIFAGSKIYYDGQKATSSDGTLAGSTTLIDKIIKKLAVKGLFDIQYIYNPYDYHKLKADGEIVWDDCWNISEITYRGRDIL